MRMFYYLNKPNEALEVSEIFLENTTEVCKTLNYQNINVSEM